MGMLDIDRPLKMGEIKSIRSNGGSTLLSLELLFSPTTIAKFEVTNYNQSRGFGKLFINIFIDKNRIANRPSEIIVFQMTQRIRNSDSQRSACVLKSVFCFSNAKMTLTSFLATCDMATLWGLPSSRFLA